MAAKKAKSEKEPKARRRGKVKAAKRGRPAKAETKKVVRIAKAKKVKAARSRKEAKEPKATRAAKAVKAKSTKAAQAKMRRAKEPRVRSQIGAFIAARRAALDMTMRDLAEKLDVTPQAISAWENIPTIQFPYQRVPAVAEALKVEAKELYEALQVGGTVTDEPAAA